VTESQPAARDSVREGARDADAPNPPIRPARPARFLAIVFLSLIAVVGVSRWLAPRELVPWRDDLAAAQADARALNKPVLLYFTARWCAPCQTMRRHVWTDRGVATDASAYLPVRIDVDQQPALARQFGVETVPYLLVLDTEGRPVWKVDRGLDANAMRAFLRGEQTRTLPGSLSSP
jgi:thioredoxin 1